MIIQENDYTNRHFQSEVVEKDLVVVGAGLAGLSVAITAARQGVKVALITDRPILGGSASSEIRVGPGGADASPWNRFARETGIMEEIFNHIHYKASFSGKWRWFYFDQLYFDMVLKEPNISCFLNTTIYKATRDEWNNIASIEGIQLRSEKKIEFRGRMFADCSGDGTVGFLAGADYRIGREAKGEFNEVFSPEEADKGTMGATLLFTSIDTGHPVKFNAPEWSVPFRDIPSFNRLHRGMGKMPDGSFYGFWWVEYGGDVDSIHEDDQVVWHLRKLVYGIWDYVKNSGEFKDVENHDMNWIGYLPGKRESRRLMGPYIATSNDFLSQRSFTDTIGFAGWPIDIHPPEGYRALEPGCTHEYLPGITDIPFRCLYSRNIPNLLFAGRDISATHEGLGTLRLISTTSVMGQAVGQAAVMCLEKNILPEQIYGNHMDELQQRLARVDQSIIGYRLKEDEDYSRKAVASASSVREVKLEKPEHFRVLYQPTGLILPVETEKLETLSVYLKADMPTQVTADIYGCDDKPQNYRITSMLKSVTLDCNEEKWYDFDLNVRNGKGKKFIILFRKNTAIKLFFEQSMLTGILGIETDDVQEMKRDSVFRQVGKAHVPLTPCFKVTPEQNYYCEKNINNGYIRPFSLPHLWSSARIEIGHPQWIQLDWQEPKSISTIELVFNSELNHPRMTTTINAVNAQMVKSYEIIAKTDYGEEVLVKEDENFLRFRVHKFDPVVATAVKLVVYETWGDKHAEVYDFRVYEK